MTVNDVTTDLATDYDIFGEQFVSDPYSVYDELRGTCPIAHSDRHGGSWLPTTYQDIYDIAHDVDHFSSRQVSLLPPPERATPDAYVEAGVPPISSDPPVHQWARRLILPLFAPKAVRKYEDGTRALCHKLIDGFIDAGQADVGTDYAQQIPSGSSPRCSGCRDDGSDEFVAGCAGS